MDIEKFLDSYFNSTTATKVENGFLLTTPIMYKFSNTREVFLLTEDEDGFVTISDQGRTMDYVNENGIEIEKYNEAIKNICKQNDIVFENNCFKRELPSYQTNQIMRALFAYFGALNTIANLDDFED